MRIVRRKKPKVWSSRTARGVAWWITWPAGDISSYGRSWRAAIEALDRWIDRRWPKQQILLTDADATRALERYHWQHRDEGEREEA